MMEFHQQSGVMWQPWKGKTGLPRAGMGLAGHSKERLSFLRGKKSYVGLGGLLCAHFWMVCAVVSLHVEVWQVVPVAFLPFTPLCPCQVLVDAFKQLSVHECNYKLTQASSLESTPGVSTCRQGRLWPDTHPFPPSWECLCHWEKLGRSLHLSSLHSICAFLFLFHFCVLLLTGCSSPVCTYWSWLGRHFPVKKPRELGTAHPPFS